MDMALSLDASDVAKRLRQAADILECGDWQAVFCGRDVAGSAFATLDQFCKTAENFGSAPSFAEQQDWFASYLDR
jgi:hypothetical protein